jgi:glycine/D-amino acid oxidase-like deaminating enzyme
MATRKKQLRAGKSIWQGFPAPRIATRKSMSGMSADVLVIGAGISGALIAERAASAGLSVIIADRRGPILGSTPASTALVQFEIDTPLTKLRARIGEKNAIRAWRRSKLAVENLAHRTEHLGIDCHMLRRNSLYLAGNSLNAKQLDEEGAARNAAGFETAVLSRSQLHTAYGLRRSRALLSFGNLVLNPRLLTAGYLRAALAMGVRILSPVEVIRVEDRAYGISASLKGGKLIRAKAVIYATGYELPDFVKLRSLNIASTFALATYPQPRRLWPTQAMIWEASDPYLYMRTTPDGRIICGGEDEEFSDEDKRNALLPEKVRRIRAKLQRLMPWVDTTPEFEWSASFGVSSTGLPRIGRIPGRKNVYAALGYGGNGITFSRIAAELLLSQIQGRVDPDADLFAFKS